MVNSNSLQSQIDKLQNTACQLLHLGQDTGYVYADDLARLNREVHEQINALYNKRGKTTEEEASLCLAALMGYAGSMYANPSDERKKQSILKRCWKVLDKLADSLLKCQLLVYCYGEVYDEELAAQAQEIISSWDNDGWTKNQKEIGQLLEALKEKSVYVEG